MPPFVLSQLSWNKGLNAREIQAQVGSLYGTDAGQSTTMKKWRTPFPQDRTDLFNDSKSGRPLIRDLPEAIRSMLVEKLFSSCKFLWHYVQITKTAFLKILRNNLGMQQFHLHWVPHTRFPNQQSERITYSTLLLAELEDAEQTGFQRIITGES
jgi:hypothetical protein